MNNSNNDNIQIISSPNSNRNINRNRIARMIQNDMDIAKKQSTSFGKLILGDERNSPIISKLIYISKFVNINTLI